VNAKTTTAETVALRDAKSRHLDALAELQRVEQAVQPPPAETEQEATARAALDVATRTLEDTAAAHALGDATDDDLAQARQAQAAAQAEAAHITQEAAEAKGRAAAAAAGLARRLQTVREEADAAAEALRLAEVAWLRTRIIVLDKTHRAAAEQLVIAFHEAKACASAIERRCRGERLGNVAPGLGGIKIARVHDLFDALIGDPVRSDPRLHPLIDIEQDLALEAAAK